MYTKLISTKNAYKILQIYLIKIRIIYPKPPFFDGNWLEQVISGREPQIEKIQSQIEKIQSKHFFSGQTIPCHWWIFLMGAGGGSVLITLLRILNHLLIGSRHTHPFLTFWMPNNTLMKIFTQKHSNCIFPIALMLAFLDTLKYMKTMLRTPMLHPPLSLSLSLSLSFSLSLSLNSNYSKN